MQIRPSTCDLLERALNFRHEDRAGGSSRRPFLQADQEECTYPIPDLNYARTIIAFGITTLESCSHKDGPPPSWPNAIFGSRDGPLGTAQLFNTPRISRRRS